MNSKQLFVESIDVGEAVISYVGPEHFSNTTPCREWDMRTLIQHILNEIAWIPDIVASKTIDEVGNKYDGDLISDNLQASFKKLADKARKSVAKADIKALAHLSYADVPVGNYVREASADILIHSWDVAQGLSCNLWLNEPLVIRVYDNIFPRRDEFAASGLFGRPTETDDNVSMQVRLLALVGRRAPTV